jgi:hypothetical protein
MSMTGVKGNIIRDTITKDITSNVKGEDTLPTTTLLTTAYPILTARADKAII